MAKTLEAMVEQAGTTNPERFTEFTLTISAKTGDLDSLQKAVTIAERACQVVNTLRLAAPVNVVVEKGVAAL